MTSSFPLHAVRDLVEPGTLWSPAKGSDEVIRYIDVSAVNRDELEITGATEHTPRTAPSRARKLVSANDTLFATIRPGLRRIAQVPHELDGAVASTAFCVLRPKLAIVDPDFLFFATSRERFVAAVADLQTGASYPAVRDADVLNGEIPLPPLDEQRQIALVLRTIRKALSCEATLIRQASMLKRAAMRELFARGVRGDTQKETEIGLIPQGWDVCEIGKHFALSSGGTPLRANPSFWSGGTIPWVKTAEVDYGVILSAEECITHEGLRSSAAKLLPVGTLLMAMYGQGVTRGKVALLGIQACCNQACAAFHPLDDAVETKFLYYYLTHSYDELRRYSHGGQQQNLNMDIVRAFRVAHPKDHAEQHDIVVILEAIDQKVAVHKQKRGVLDALCKSLQHKLITGELRVSELDLSVLEDATATQVLA